LWGLKGWQEDRPKSENIRYHEGYACGEVFGMPSFEKALLLLSHFKDKISVD